MSIRIEHGIKPPDEYRLLRRYPLAEMSVGDSFFVPYESPADAIRLRDSLYNAIGHYTQGKSGFGRRYRVKLESKGIRVWRLAALNGDRK